MKVRFRNTVFYKGIEYKANEIYEVDEEDYKAFKTDCEIVEEAKIEKDKMIRKAPKQKEE